MKTIWIAALAAGVCAGCATPQDLYQAPAAAPTAQLVFAKGYRSQLTAPGTQGYWMADGPQCADRKGGPAFAPGSANQKTWTVAASGGRIYVHAQTSYIYTQRVTITAGQPDPQLAHADCAVDFSLKPEPGRVYAVIQRSEFGGACPVEVIDKATGRPPPSMAIEEPCEGAPV